MLSKTCEIAIRAAIYVASVSCDGHRVTLSEIAREIGTPLAFTGKILQKLVHNGILVSTRGVAGGFVIDEQMQRATTVAQIVRIIDGDDLYLRCILGLPQCDAAHPCPVHEQYQPIRAELISFLEATTITYLSARVGTGDVNLKTSLLEGI